MLGVVGQAQNTETQNIPLYFDFRLLLAHKDTRVNNYWVWDLIEEHISPPSPEWKLHLCISMHGWSAIEMLICVFHQLDSFFCSPLLQKITFIISVSNTYWPGVTLWHVPTAYNHACLPLSIPRDLSAPFLFSASTECRAFARLLNNKRWIKREDKNRYFT